MGPGRLELPTSRLSGVCSNQLSYRPLKRQVPDQVRNTRSHRSLCRGCDVIRKEKRRRRHPATCLVSVNEPIGREPWRFILRKEVIQPQVPLRLPCYDFTPVADPTVVDCLLAVSASPSGRTNSHGVTGGVYKARERIHRGMLIRDY